MPIVVAVDNSAGSGAAIQLAANEARCRQTDLLAVTAYRAERAVAAPAGRPVGSMRTGEEDRQAAELLLRDTVTEALGDAAPGVLTKVVAGPPGKVIVDTAKTAQAELIVLATRPGLAILPGTTGQYVLRNAGRPVLLVPAGRHSASTGG